MNSKELKAQASREDNDLKAMGILNKALREERSERFTEQWLDKLSNVCDVNHSVSKGCWTFAVEPYGTMDYYPKANKVLIRQKNKWVKPGLRWIIKNIIKL